MPSVDWEAVRELIVAVTGLPPTVKATRAEFTLKEPEQLSEVIPDHFTSAEWPDKKIKAQVMISDAPGALYSVAGKVPASFKS